MFLFEAEAVAPAIPRETTDVRAKIGLRKQHKMCDVCFCATVHVDVCVSVYVVFFIAFFFFDA